MNIPPMRNVKEYRIQAVLLAAIVLTAALLLCTL